MKKHALILSLLLLSWLTPMAFARSQGTEEVVSVINEMVQKARLQEITGEFTETARELELIEFGTYEDARLPITRMRIAITGTMETVVIYAKETTSITSISTTFTNHTAIRGSILESGPSAWSGNILTNVLFVRPRFDNAGGFQSISLQFDPVIADRTTGSLPYRTSYVGSIHDVLVSSTSVTEGEKRTSTTITAIGERKTLEQYSLEGGEFQADVVEGTTLEEVRVTVTYTIVAEFGADIWGEFAFDEDAVQNALFTQIDQLGQSLDAFLESNLVLILYFAGFIVIAMIIFIVVMERQRPGRRR